MRQTLSYTTIIGGQETTVTRHPPSDGNGLTQADLKGTVKQKKNTKKPVDEQLHALDMFLASAIEHEDDIIGDIENSIAKRVKELTGV